MKPYIRDRVRFAADPYLQLETLYCDIENLRPNLFFNISKTQLGFYPL